MDMLSHIDTQLAQTKQTLYQLEKARETAYQLEKVRETEVAMRLKEHHNKDLVITALGAAVVVVAALPMIQQLGMFIAIALVVFLLVKYYSKRG
jgi:hypothetical protein